MKVGDIVQLRHSGKSKASGIIIKLFEKKCWRTSKLGKKVNWDVIDPEEHAEVLIKEDILNIPTADLKVIFTRQKDV